MSSTRLAFKLSSAIRKTAVPIIPLAKSWAQLYTLNPRYGPLLNLAQGHPGTPPPSYILESLACESQDKKNCAYGPVIGEECLRSALVDEMKFIYGEGTDLKKEDMVITAGCNMAFGAAVLAIATAGDEIILPVPWYFNHSMTLDMLGIIPVPLHTDASTHYLPNIEECKKLITERTRAISLVTPNNPTGATYSHDLLRSFAHLAKSNNLALILDETYRDMILDGRPHDLFTPSEEKGMEWSWRSTIIHLFSFSKSYCLPGHRLGAIVANGEVLEQIGKFLDNIQVCPPIPPQKAVAPHLATLRPFIKSSASAIHARQQLFTSVLPSGWKVLSQGGYYAWVRHPFQGVSSELFCKVLASEFGILALPSNGFAPTAGEKGELDEEGKECMRIAVANVTDDDIRMLGERLERIHEDLERSIRKL